MPNPKKIADGNFFGKKQFLAILFFKCQVYGNCLHSYGNYTEGQVQTLCDHTNHTIRFLSALRNGMSVELVSLVEFLELLCLSLGVPVGVWELYSRVWIRLAPNGTNLGPIWPNLDGKFDTQIYSCQYVKYW